MNANNIEMILDILISGARPKDRHGLLTTFLESLKKFLGQKMSSHLSNPLD